MILRLAYAISLFVGSLAIGWLLGRRGVLTERSAGRLLRFGVKVLSPAVLMLLFWRFDLANWQAFALPALGCAVLFSTCLPAWLYGRLAHLSRPEMGSFLTCAMFSNVGYLGALIAFALYGESAYALAALYLVYFSPCFYVVAFTIARRFGSLDRLEQARSGNSELRLYPVAGLCIGLLLSAAHIPRPASLEWIGHVLIPLDTTCYLIAIGSQLRLEPMRGIMRHCVAMSAIKFLYTPAIGWLIVWSAHLTGLTRFVVLLQTCMPVATSPLMLPVLFGVDRRLANGLWLFTTLLAIPILVFYVPAILP